MQPAAPGMLICCVCPSGGRNNAAPAGGQEHRNGWADGQANTKMRSL
jgi:hypothetical protein